MFRLLRWVGKHLMILFPIIRVGKFHRFIDIINYLMKGIIEGYFRG